MITQQTIPDVEQLLDRITKEYLRFLKPVEESWQPSDVLPDLTKENWREEVDRLRKGARTLPDDILVALVGNTVTEEALPSYQTWLNRCPGFRDETGTSMTPWAIWTRGWTAEENRHGELLNKYLYLSGRVNMRSFEVTTQHLIRNGFDVKSGADPYRSLVYTSFQERATKISHSNVGLLAEKHGDAMLGKVCAVIAGDEARHEEAYKRIVGRIFEVDPSNAVIAFYDMMKRAIAMPARLMSDGTDRDLFEEFSVVAQRAGVYTVRDYANVIDHLVRFWKVASLSSLSGAAAKAQEYLCKLPERYYRKVELFQEAIAEEPRRSFEWIFGRRA